MAEEAVSAPAEVLPPLVSHLLGLAWILLFAGRWIVAQLLIAAGLLSANAVAELDDRVLMRLYLVLLAITILVAVLQAMRGAKSGSGAMLNGPADRGGTGDKAAASDPRAAFRRPNTGD